MEERNSPGNNNQGVNSSTNAASQSTIHTESKKVEATEVKPTASSERSSRKFVVIFIVVILLLTLCGFCGVAGYLSFITASKSANEALDEVSDAQEAFVMTRYNLALIRYYADNLVYPDNLQALDPAYTEYNQSEIDRYLISYTVSDDRKSYELTSKSGQYDSSDIIGDFTGDSNYRDPFDAKVFVEDTQSMLEDYYANNAEYPDSLEELNSYEWYEYGEDLYKQFNATYESEMSGQSYILIVNGKTYTPYPEGGQFAE